MGMECPYCNHLETKVTDSRDTGTYTIRRRRGRTQFVEGESASNVTNDSQHMNTLN